MKKVIRYFSILVLFLSKMVVSTNSVSNSVGGYVGHATIAYCIAKVVAKKYNLPFHYKPYSYSDIFELDVIEKNNQAVPYDKEIHVKTEDQIKFNLKNNRLRFDITIYTLIHAIDFDPLKLLRPLLQIRNKDEIESEINKLPDDCLRIAVHIRKGTGGAQQYDGQQGSEQLFSHDLGKIQYVTSGVSYPFDWGSYVGPINRLQETRGSKLFVDKVPGWGTKFPPEQFYIDQIIKILREYPSDFFYVQVFTDDKYPFQLVERIKQAVNSSQVSFYYFDNRNYSFKRRSAQDMYSMSRFDVLIRSQSYFGRVVELMSDFKMVIFPLEYHWEKNKLIMNKIFIKGCL